MEIFKGLIIKRKSYQWYKNIVDDGKEIDLYYTFIIKTSSGNAYDVSIGMNVYNDNGQIKFEIKP